MSQGSVKFSYSSFPYKKSSGYHLCIYTQVQFIHVYIHALYIHIIHTHLLYIWHTEMMEKTNDVGQTAKEKALKINVELSWYILHLYS